MGISGRNEDQDQERCKEVGMEGFCRTWLHEFTIRVGLQGAVKPSDGNYIPFILRKCFHSRY